MNGSYPLEIFFYYECPGLKQSDSLDFGIVNDDNICTYSKVEEKYDEDGNNSYSGILRISKLNIYGDQIITLRITGGKATYALNKPLNFKVNLKLKIKPLYEITRENLIKEDKTRLVVPYYDIENEEEAAEVATESIGGVLDGFLYEEVEFGEFDKSTLDSDGYMKKELTYIAEYKEDKTYSYRFNYLYFPGENTMLGFHKATDITDKIESMDEEEKKEVAKEEADKLQEEMDKSFIKALYPVVEGEDRETDFEFVDVLENLENYIPTEKDAPEEYYSKVSLILTIVNNIGLVTSILILAVLGIKYMLGSVEEKADYKKDMIPYLVGAGLLFGITSIVKIMQSIGDNINSI